MTSEKLLKISLLLTISFLINGMIFSQQSNRQWWNSLSPAWKKVFLLDQFKGKEVDPSDEDLDRIVKIKRINCSDNKEITDLKPLSQLTLLEQVKCSRCPGLKGLEGLENLRNLILLDCSENDNISSLKPIEGLTSLKILNASQSMIKNLGPLMTLGNLEELYLNNTTINELIFLKNLAKLTKLDVSENATLYSIDGVQFLGNLLEFNCSNTDVYDLTPLQNMKNLRVLDVSKTQIKTLKALQNVKSIQEINCNNTQINTLKYLFANPNLSIISARGTRIPKEDIKFTIDAITRINYQPKSLIFELDHN